MSPSAAALLGTLGDCPTGNAGPSKVVELASE